MLSYSVQFSSVTQSCPTLYNPMDCSTPGLSVYHQLPEFTQTHVYGVDDAIQPSHPVVPFSCIIYWLKPILALLTAWIPILCGRSFLFFLIRVQPFVSMILPILSSRIFKYISRQYSPDQTINY